MKRLFLSILAAAAISTVAMADVTTVKTLYAAEEGAEGTNVTWESTMKFDAADFADVNVGDFIYITFSSTTDVIEVKANGAWLPGSRFTNLGENTPDFRCYLTADGLATLKEYGLEICGKNFTVTGVSICNDGFVMPDGAVWGGYFWVDSWNTLEIWKTAFANYAGQRYLNIYISDDNGDYIGYFLKVLTKWDPETDVATNDQIQKTASVATVDLQDVDLSEMLSDVNALMIQGNKEDGPAFNIIAVTLSNEDASSAISAVIETVSAPSAVYNLQGVKVRDNSDDLSGLPAGIYIYNGKKHIVK